MLVPIAAPVAELRKRADAEDQERPEHDVDGVGEPEHAHRDGRVAGAAKHGVDEKQQDDVDARAEHDARERAAGADDVVAGAHRGQELRERRARR